MGIFDRVKVVEPVLLSTDPPSPAPVAKPPEVRPISRRSPPASHLQAVPVAASAAPKGHKEKVVDVESVIWDALGKFGQSVRPSGLDWLRIPAVWRGSREYNISVHRGAGFAIDWSDGGSKIPFEELMKLLEHDPGKVNLTNPNLVKVQHSANNRQRDAIDLWKKGNPLTSVAYASRIGRQYLKNRGIPDDQISRIAAQIRAVPGDFGGVTLVLPIFAPSQKGRMIGVQRIFLNSNAEKYGNDPKKMLGSHFDGDRAGGFLIPGDRTRFTKKEVAVVEGFETGMAVSSATGMPVYCLYTAVGVRAIHLEYLSSLGVESVLFAEDNDDPDKQGRRAGQEATEFMGEKMHTENIPMRRATPPRQLVNGRKCDWLDIWNVDPVACARLLLNAPVFTPKPKPLPTVKPAMMDVFGRKKASMR